MGVGGRKKAGLGALLVKLFWFFPRSLNVDGAAAFDAPRTCFSPKTWTADGAGLDASSSRTDGVHAIRSPLSCHHHSCRLTLDDDRSIKHDCFS
jgi:hypothetical protein